MRFLSAALIFVFLIGLEFPVRAEPLDAIKVVVHNAIVTDYQVDDFTEPLLRNLASQYPNDPQGFEKRREKLIEDNTEILVEQQLILHEFETAGYNLPEQAIDDYIQSNIRSRYGDEATLTKSLQAQGLTREKYRKQIRDRFIIEQMRLRNISDVVMISPHKIEVYYEAHTNDFKLEDQVKLRMIVLTKPAGDTGDVRKLADEISTKIKNGASFAQMATIYSKDPKASQGGDWDWEDTSVLRKELSDAATALKTGETSGVIETPDACYIMQVEDKKPAHIKPLADVRDDIEKLLLGAEQDRLQKQWIEKLKKKTFVRYFYSAN